MATRTLLLTASLLAFTGFSLAATESYAKPKHDRGHQNDTAEAIEDVANALISLTDRTIIRDYLRENRPNCPPGLAKKNNGCLPPGIAKKYAMGRPLPPGIAAKRLPGDLLSRLHPVPGYQYVQVDHDVLLMAEATKKIVDAVTLLSAVK